MTSTQSFSVMQSLCQGGAKKSKVRISTTKDKAKSRNNNVSFIYKIDGERNGHPSRPLSNLGREMVTDPFFSHTMNAINTSLIICTLFSTSNLVHVKEDEFKAGCSLLPSVSARATRGSYVCELGRFVCCSCLSLIVS
jgi:hypothetical protein